jgi:Zn-dependent protease with chaperone function
MNLHAPIFFKAIGFVVLNLVSLAASSQQTPFLPFHKEGKDTLAVQLAKRVYERERKSINFPKKDGREFILEQCSLRYEKVKYLSDEDVFLTGSQPDRFLQSIVNEIESANPVLKGKVRVVLAREPEPNAYSLGNGVIIFNLGMLARLRTEAEIAFILCHEFSHYLLDHSNRDLYAMAEKITDKELKKQLRSALKEEYNVKKKVFNLILPGVMEDRKYSRRDELQADSSGLRLLSKTKYATEAALINMDFLDSLDIKEPDTLELKRYFTIAGVEQGKYWFDYRGSSSLAGVSQERSALEDSLKTHPDCKLRKKELSTLLGSSGSGTYYLQPVDSFHIFVKNTKGEYIQMWLDYMNAGRAVYHSIYYLHDYPSDPFASAAISMSLSLLSVKKKSLYGGKYLGTVHPDFAESYNKLKSFLLEITPAEAAALAYNMLQREDANRYTNEAYLSALALSAFANGKTEEYNKLNQELKSRFPEPRYRNYFEAVNAWVIPEVKRKK